MIANDCEKKEDLPDICKAALLIYYSNREYPEEMEEVLHHDSVRDVREAD